MPKRPPQSFRAAFEGCLLDRTGIVVTYGVFREDELRRDRNAALRLGGFAGDSLPENVEALKAAGENAKDMSEDLHGPEGLLGIVGKLGPVNQNLTSEGFIKPFFKHLNLGELNITSLDADLVKFSNLTFLDVSRNNLFAVENLSPNLKFLKAYNNAITRITCARQPSLCFLGAGYNALGAAGMSQLAQRFRGLLSLDLAFNNLTGLREFLDDAKTLRQMKQLCLQGNPLCLLPFYRLVIIKHLPQLQLLDGQGVDEAEVADSGLVGDGHLQMPQHLNVEISFSQVTFLKRLLVPLAKEMPDTKLGDDEVEVPVSEEDRITELARQGQLFFRFELLGDRDDPWVETTAVNIEEPVVEEIPEKGKKAPAPPVDDTPKTPGEPIDLSGLGVSSADGFLPVPEEGASTAPAPLFFPLPLGFGEPAEGLLQLRDWLRIGMRVQALYRKKPTEVDPSSTAPPDGEEAAEEAPPVVEAPRLIGGGVLSMSSTLCPLVTPVSDEIRQEGVLPVLPPPFSIGPDALVLAPYSRWLEPDVQVPLASASKSLSDVSATVTMDVRLYAAEAVPEEKEAEPT